MELRSMYDTGDGVEQDFAKAVEFYELTQDHAKAQYSLGVRYYMA